MVEKLEKLPEWLQVLLSPFIYAIVMIPIAIVGFIILAIIGTISPGRNQTHSCSSWDEEACEYLNEPIDEPTRDPWENRY